MKKRTTGKRWKAFLCGVMAASCLLGSIPMGAFASGTDTVDLAAGLAYQTNWKSDEFNAGHEDIDHIKLTDGKTAANIWSSDAIHFHKRDSNEAVTLTFDLGGSKYIYNVIVAGVDDDAAGVRNPTQYTVEYYDAETSQWKSAYDETPGRSPTAVYVYDAELIGTPVQTSKIRLSLTPDAEKTFLCLTAVKIMGSDALLPLPDDSGNILKGVSYETPLKDGDAGAVPPTGDFHKDHPDMGRIKLTDGKKALDPDWNDSAVVGFHTSMDAEVTDKRVPLTFCFDQEKNFEQINISVFQDKNSWIFMASDVLIEYRDADNQWHSLYDGILEKTNDNHKKYVYVVPNGKSIAATGIRFFFTTDGYWIFADEIEAFEKADGSIPNLVPSDDPNIAQVPTITSDLPMTKSALVGENVSFTVAATTADGGTLSYQWYQGNQPIGTNNSTFAISGAALTDSGTYKVVVTNAKDGVSKTAESAICTLSVTTEPVIEPDNLIAGVPYTTNMTDADYHGEHLDTNHTKLTDGQKANAWSSADSVGFHTFGSMSTFHLTFALGKEISFQQINVGVQMDNASGIGCPASIKIERKNGANEKWETIYNGNTSGATKNTTFIFAAATEKIAATDLRFTLQGGNSWLFMDEIQVLAESGTDEAFGKLVVPSEPETENFINLLEGCSYEATQPTTAPYLDDGTKLTDGKTGGNSFNDPAWTGYSFWGSGGKTPVEITFDMGSSQSFDKFRMNLLQNSSLGILFPKKMDIFISEDKGSWVKLNQGAPTFDVIVDLGEKQSFEQVKVGFLKAKGEPPAEMLYPYSYTTPSAVKARYIKISFDYDSWVFIDEVQVLKATDGGKNAKAAALAQTREQSIYSVNADRSNPNNIAAGCSYTTSWASMPDRLDHGGKLTDGRRGTGNYAAKEWVGYDGSAGVGAIQSSNAPSSELPTAIRVAYSDDQIKWLDAAQSDLPEYQTAGDGAKRFNQPLMGKVSARYVKFTMNISDSLAIDEIEILKTLDSSDDADINADNGETFNLIQNYDYVVSRTADDHKKANLLTDGICGSLLTPPDENWAGWKYSATQSEKNHVALTFDLTSLNSVSKILLHTRSQSQSQIAPPKNLVLKVSVDGTNWEVLKTFAEISDSTAEEILTWDGSVDRFIASLSNATMAYIRYARFEFDLTSDSTTYVDEVEIIGKRGKCSTAGLVMKPHGDLYNVALGKTYTASPYGKENLYPDINGIELTDGILGMPQPSDPAWVGYMAVDLPNGKMTERWPIKSIVIDLADTKTITEINFSMLSEGSALINQPWSVRTFASMDGKSWTALSKNTSVNIWGSRRDSYGWHFKDSSGTSVDLTDGLSMVPARYVRVDIELVNWNAIDEITVMGYDGIKEGATLPEGRYYDNGREYLKPGENTTNGIYDMFLAYNGDYGIDAVTGKEVGDWTPEMFKPYLTYMNTQGKSVDTMFDSVLFLALQSKYGRPFLGAVLAGDSLPQIEDWTWYLDKMFRSGGDVENLNTAAKQAAIDLNDPNYKANMVIMIPGIESKCVNFGTLNGRTLNLSVEADWKYLLDWYIHEITSYVEKGQYDHINFKGFYWLNEDGGYTRNIIEYAADKVHETGTYFYWIPFYFGSGALWSRDLGFDATALQPNHFFADPGDDKGYGADGTKQVINAAKLASYANIGIEIECDERMLTDPTRYNQYLDYLNASVENGFGGRDVYRNWYNGVRTFGAAARSTIPKVRNLYDYTYQMIKGNLTEKIPYITTLSGEGDGYHPDDSGSSASGGGTATPTKPTAPIVPEKPSAEKFVWEKTSGGWKLKGNDGKYVTGWKKIDGLWFYMNADGVMQKGWQKIGGTWYYLKDSGAMAIGWQKIGGTWYYLKDSGAMAIGWQWIENKCYYFDESGKMAINRTINGYKVDVNGAWIP